MTEPTGPDGAFFDRADSFIRLANEHCQTIGQGKVSASFLFAVSRFHASVVASACSSAEEMATERAAAITYFLGEFRKMLEENLDDYIENFTAYTRQDA